MKSASIARQAFLLFCFSGSCFAMDKASVVPLDSICSADVSEQECHAYGQKGLDFTMCRWRHVLPGFNNMSLADRNLIYELSHKSCEAWKAEHTEQPSSMIPDVEGAYCFLAQQYPERAAPCAHYKRAQLAWQIQALANFETLHGLSLEADEIFASERRRIKNEQADLEQKAAALLGSSVTFPQNPRGRSWFGYAPIPLLFGLGLWYWMNSDKSGD